ncbi:MAG: response regulator [Mastigocoleus sp.]
MATIDVNQKILIIDDKPTNIEILYNELDKAGYKILVEMDGLQGIVTAKSQSPDLILLDVMMPEIDGFEACRQLKSEITTCDIPIIFMTALDDSTEKVKGLKLGAVDYITKPFQQQEVLARIGVHLKLRKLNLELAQQKDMLEKRVQEHTEELSSALESLQKAQLQIVQNEKMATLGNLVAGVAHEVNNPIGFLTGSIENTREYVTDLLVHIECYQQHYPTPVDAVSKHAANIDLEYLTEDVPRLLDSMEVATERIIDISESLRTFSRADTTEKVACNIHEGIESTLLILKYRLKANDKRPEIEVIREYGNLPRVKCFLGQLNQVFMNIIANAIDALDTAIEGKTFVQLTANPQKITIKTETSAENNVLLIRIKDNGLGIPENIKSHVFDNLFTTKAVNKGTGLGLAIARQIIEETHAGKISCNSQVGKGTEFIIEIPL